MNKTIKKQTGNKGPFRLESLRKWSYKSNLICEEFCYESGLKHIQLATFPSTIFGTKNLKYILSGIKNAEQLTEE